MSLIELAERAEKASGPDRELDKAIWAALGNCNHDRTGGYICLDCGKDTYGEKSAPVFTASLDAAMTLVPEGWCFEVTCWKDGNGTACVSQYNPGDQDHTGHAATPAIALVAAALRARAQQEQGER